MISTALLTITINATAQAGSPPPASLAAGDCHIEPDVPAAEWRRDSHGTIQPEIVVDNPAPPGHTYWVDFRLNFDGQDARWTQGPYASPQMGPLTIPLQIPAAGRMSTAQGDYVSVLLTTIRVGDNEEPSSADGRGERLDWLRVGLPQTGSPVLFDRQQAKTLAPGGVWSASERAALTSLGVTLSETRSVSPGLRQSLELAR